MFHVWTAAYGLHYGAGSFSPLAHRRADPRQACAEQHHCRWLRDGGYGPADVNAGTITDGEGGYGYRAGAQETSTGVHEATRSTRQRIRKQDGQNCSGWGWWRRNASERSHVGAEEGVAAAEIERKPAVEDVACRVVLAVTFG